MGQPAVVFLLCLCFSLCILLRNWVWLAVLRGTRMGRQQCLPFSIVQSRNGINRCLGLWHIAKHSEANWMQNVAGSFSIYATTLYYNKRRVGYKESINAVVKGCVIVANEGHSTVSGPHWQESRNLSTALTHSL